MLHDTIDDYGAAHGPSIEARFGPRVAGVVRACSDADVQPKPPWQARKEAYLAYLEKADADTLLVRCVDKLHNASAIATTCTRMARRGSSALTRPGRDSLGLLGTG